MVQGRCGAPFFRDGTRPSALHINKEEAAKTSPFPLKDPYKSKMLEQHSAEIHCGYNQTAA
jgi:hypothetical protein